jgi:hypothetical protein
MLHTLLRLDHSEGMAEAFVLDDGCMAYPSEKSKISTY